MIARVRGVMAASIRAGSMLYVSGSMSTKTGRAPSRQIVLAVAKKVYGVVMTSSPGPIPRAIKGSSRASVPEPQPTPRAAPQYSASSASSCATSGPMTNIWLSITRRTTSSISSRIVRYCAFRSSAGTATLFGGTLIGDHSFDASGGCQGLQPAGDVPDLLPWRYRTTHASGSHQLCQWRSARVGPEWLDGSG